MGVGGEAGPGPAGRNWLAAVGDPFGVCRRGSDVRRRRFASGDLGWSSTSGARGWRRALTNIVVDVGFGRLAPSCQLPRQRTAGTKDVKRNRDGRTFRPGRGPFAGCERPRRLADPRPALGLPAASRRRVPTRGSRLALAPDAQAALIEAAHPADHPTRRRGGTRRPPPPGSGGRDARESAPLSAVSHPRR